MRVVITGAAGFIGGHLSQRLLSEGHRVLGLDSFHDNYDPQIKRATVSALETHPSWRFLEGDIRHGALLDDALSGADAVIHLAALVGVRASLEQAAEYMDVNVRGSTLLLEACRRAGVRRVVMASSSSVYGDSAQAPFREDRPLGRPLSPYAASKRAMEVVAAAYQGLYALNIAVLRFFTVYGPRQRPDLAIHKFARLILEGRPIPVYGDGSSRRDYTHVADITRGIAGALSWTGEGQGPRMRAFNLASGRTVTLAEMIAAVEVATGKRALIERLPDQPGDMGETWGDVGRARAELGLPQPMDFQEGVADFVAWMEANGG